MATTTARPTVIMHAGMGKTGSSSIQSWLERNAAAVRDQGVTPICVGSLGGGEHVTLMPYETGSLNASPVIHVLQDQVHGAQAANQLIAELGRLADEFGTVLISGESLNQVFWERRASVLEPLNELAGRCAVIVAYYVRPQPSALEAAWRQWGFRRGALPAAYLRGRSKMMFYGATLEYIRRATPNIDFRMRPFRRDLLSGGDVVADFATAFLNLAGDSEGAETAENVGLPLPLVNLLSKVPSDGLWESMDDNRVVDVLRDVFAGMTIEDERADQGRLVLQRWAYKKFAEDTQLLRELTGWTLENWLPEPADGDANLRLLNELWSPHASPVELQMVQRLIAAVAAPRR